MSKQVKWFKYATCKGMVPPKDEEFKPEKHDYFFDAYERSDEVRASVDQMCIVCPVRQLCEEYGVSSKLEGVWGGFYLTSQGEIDRNKNKHKTEEVWEALQ